MTRNTAQKSKSNPYIVQQVNSASPEKLILMLYEIGLRSCEARDKQKTAIVLTELIGALNFDYKEIALSLFDLYRFALDQVHQSNFENTHFILQELHDVWKSAVIEKHA